MHTLSDNSIKKMRTHALEIFYQGLNAVKPQPAIETHCHVNSTVLTVDSQSYDLSSFKHIWVVGAGKAAASMASALEHLLGDSISGGWITVKYDHLAPLKTINILEAGHPIPDKNGITGTRNIMNVASSATPEDLVICLISGGGSALLPLPAEGLTLEDKQSTVKALLACGATIHEINTLRKHLSAIKGGQLAQKVHPATLITLILSDVVGDNLDVIASGPTVPDETTFEDCIAVIKKYDLEDKLPQAVITHLQNGAAGKIPETPKPHMPFFQNSQNIIIGSNFMALMAAEQKAKDLGYDTMVLSSQLEGDTAESAKFHCAIAKGILSSGHPVNPPACILSGGETTVKLKGTGLGGRNQEFALVSAFEIHNQNNIVVLSAGTDGTDGPTDAAGAVSDNHTIDKAVSENLNSEAYLTNNDSYHFFKQLDDLVITGPTLTNVMDLRILLVKPD